MPGEQFGLWCYRKALEVGRPIGNEGMGCGMVVRKEAVTRAIYCGLTVCQERF